MNSLLMKRHRLLAGIVMAALVVGVLPSSAQEDGDLNPTGIPLDENPLERERSAVLLTTHEARAEVLREMIIASARGYRSAAIARSAALAEYQRALSELDRQVVRPDEITVERLESLEEDRDRLAARWVAAQRETERRLADLRQLLLEQTSIHRRVADLRARLPIEQETLTGVWEVSWFPAGITGTFYLDQSGTLVTGQYRLGPIGSGSLQGTFVSGKLNLQRIDAERGRDAELTGLFDPDGKRIRGTWQAYELVQGGLPQGQWVARRVK